LVEEGVRLMGKVADPLRLYAENMYANNLIDGPQLNAMCGIADQIDCEHERRMEQCRHETKRAFAKYLRQITAEYERDHKRKSWLAQQRMRLELDVLKYKEEKDEDD
jgi:hypothetical protein